MTDPTDEPPATTAGEESHEDISTFSRLNPERSLYLHQSRPLFQSQI